MLTTGSEASAKGSCDSGNAVAVFYGLPALVPGNFAEQFRPVITVRLNWSRLLSEGWPIEETTLGSPFGIGAVGLPWYSDPSRLERREYDDPDARRIYVRDVPSLMNSALAADRAGRITKRLTELEARSQSLDIVAPAYKAPGRPLLLMDRCHTCAALALGEFETDVQLLVVHGPDDPDCLGDLLPGD